MKLPEFERSLDKANRLIHISGFELTGYVLAHPKTNKRCYIDCGKVVWLNDADSQQTSSQEHVQTETGSSPS